MRVSIAMLAPAIAAGCWTDLVRAPDDRAALAPRRSEPRAHRKRLLLRPLAHTDPIDEMSPDRFLANQIPDFVFEAEVDLAAREQLEDLLGVGLAEHDPYAGVVGVKPREQRREAALEQRLQRAAEPHGTPTELGVCCDLLAGVVEREQGGVDPRRRHRHGGQDTVAV